MTHTIKNIKTLAVAVEKAFLELEFANTFWDRDFTSWIQIAIAISNGTLVDDITSALLENTFGVYFNYKEFFGASNLDNPDGHWELDKVTNIHYWTSR